MNTPTHKPFLARAAQAVQAGALDNLKADGCPEDILKVVKEMASKLKISHAQFEESANTAQLVVKPGSDSQVSFGEKIFSVPEMMELTEGIKKLIRLPDTEVECYPSDDKDRCLYVEIYRAF